MTPKLADLAARAMAAGGTAAWRGAARVCRSGVAGVQLGARLRRVLSGIRCSLHAGRTRTVAGSGDGGTLRRRNRHLDAIPDDSTTTRTSRCCSEITARLKSDEVRHFAYFYEAYRHYCAENGRPPRWQVARALLRRVLEAFDDDGDIAFGMHGTAATRSARAPRRSTQSSSARCASASRLACR